MSSKKNKLGLKALLFTPIKLQYEFQRALVRVAPGCYTDVFYEPGKIEPGSAEYWEIALRAGWVNFQFEKGLQLGEYTYPLYQNKKPRAPRKVQDSEVVE